MILALIVSKRTRRCDGDDGDDDGVRGLCHKRLRQLRWAQALKTEWVFKNTPSRKIRREHEKLTQWDSTIQDSRFNILRLESP